MKDEELFLPEGEILDDAKYREWATWRNENQHVIDWLAGHIDRLQRDARGYCSNANLTTKLRDECPYRIKPTDPHYEVNDHIIPYLKRHLVYRFPDAHLFEMRKSPERHCPTCTCYLAEAEAAV